MATSGNIIASGNYTSLYGTPGGSVPASGNYGNANVAGYLPVYGGNILANVITANTTNTGNIYANTYYFGNGSPVLFQTYGNTNVANYLPINTANIAAPNINVTGNVQSNISLANTYLWGNGVPVTFGTNYSNANVQTFLPTYVGALPGITSLAATGNVVSGANVNAVNVNANAVIATTLTGALTTANQPNITTTGILTSLTVAGAITGQGAISAAGSLSTQAELTVATNANIGGNVVANGQLFGDELNVIGGVNGATANISGNITVGSILTDGYYYANGAPFNAYGNGGSNYSNANVAGFLPIYTGNLRAGNVSIDGNLDINGQITSIDTETLTVKDIAINVASESFPRVAANGAGIQVGPLGAEYANILYDAQNDVWNINKPTLIRGNAQIAGNIFNNAIFAAGNIHSNVNVFASRVQASDLIVTSSDVPTGNITGANNIVAQYFWGDGSHLTNVGIGNVDFGNVSSNIIPTANAVYTLGNLTNQWKSLYVSGNTIYMGGANIGVASGNLQVNGANVVVAGPTGNITTTANIQGNYILGNGAFLTGISGGAGNYSNANVSAYLPTYSGNLDSLTGNVITTANVSAANYIGNGRALTGILQPPTVSSTNSALPLVVTQSNALSTANVTATLNPATGALSVYSLNTQANIVAGGGVNAATVLTTGDITSGNNISSNNMIANTYYGNGYFLTGIVATVAHQLANVSSNVDIPTANGNIYVNAANSQWTFDTANTLTAPGNINTTGNVSAEYFIGDGSKLTGIAPTVQVYEFANIVTTGGYYEAVWLADYVAGNAITVNQSVTTTPTLLAAFLTQSGYPNLTTIPVGTIAVSFETTKTGGPQSYHCYAEIWKRTAGGVETLLNTSDNTTPTALNVAVQQTVADFVATPILLDATDRILVKVYAVMTSGSAVIGITFDNNSNSGLQLPALPASISNFVPYTGATANLDLGTNSLTTTGNIAADYYTGNGSQLTGIVSSYGNANVETLLSTGITSNVITTANISGDFFLGNGAYLTGLPVQYGNANVTTLLSDGITSNVITTANISADFFLGNGSQLTGIVSSYGNSNVVTLLEDGTLTSNVVTTGNVDAGYYTGNGSQLTGMYGNIDVITLLGGGSLVTDITTTGNVTANVFIGNGSLLTGIASNYGNANVAAYLPTYSGDIGNVNVTGNLSAVTAANGTSTTQVATTEFVNYAVTIAGGYTDADVEALLSSGNVTANIITTGNITAGNSLVNGNLYVVGNANVQGTLTYNNVSSLTTDNLIIGLGNNQTGINVTGGGMVVGNTAEAQLLYNYTTQAWDSNLDLHTPNNVLAGNSIIGSNVVGNLVNATNTLFVGANISNVFTAGTVFMPGPGSNVYVPTGNVTANLFIGNGSLLTNLTPGTNIINGTSNVSIPTANGNITFSVNGSNSGYITNVGGVALGQLAGQNTSNANIVAIGYSAGSNSQGASAVAIGLNAGVTTQGGNAVAIGNAAGQTNQGPNGIAIGYLAANNAQGLQGIAIGYNAGSNAQAGLAIAIGSGAGNSSQSTNAVAIGSAAAANIQGTAAVAIGNGAGSNAQGISAIAIGSAAQTGQGNSAIAIGSNAGNTSQGANAIAIGSRAGQANQGQQTIAIGESAALNGQGLYAISIGTQSTSTGTAQGTSAIALGPFAAQSSQSANAIAVGYLAGAGSQGPSSIAIGRNAGQSSSQGGTGGNAIAIGTNAGTTTQATNAIAIGTLAGTTTQGANAIALGYGAGGNAQAAQAIAIGQGAANSTPQGVQAIAIGVNAGNIGQGSSSVAIGALTGANAQGSVSVAIGYDAGNNTQGTSSVAIGYRAGTNTQGTNSIAIGYQAGNTTQGPNAISIGYQTGLTSQATGAVAIGQQAGQSSQSAGAVAIGKLAGQSSQGLNSVAIGTSAGVTSQAGNTIIINATGSTLNGVVNQTDSFYVNPIRQDNSAVGPLSYNTITKEITYSNATPVVSVYGSTSTTIASGTASKITLDAETSDTGGWFNNTNATVTLNGISTPSYSFAPNRAGWYQVDAAVSFASMSASTGILILSLYQNGAEIKRGMRAVCNTGGSGSTVSTMVYCNGTSDTLSIVCLQGSGSAVGTETGPAFGPWFQAAWVHA